MRYMLLFLTVCSFVIASGPTICTNGYTLVNNKCWKLYTTTFTEPTADEMCRKDGGAILATLKNAIDNQALIKFVNNTDVDSLWLGMKCVGLSKYSCNWDDQTIVGYSSFASGFPNDAFGNCVYYSVNGNPPAQWASGRCNEYLPFVCELPTSTRDNGTSCVYNYANHCYARNSQLESFSDAQTSCEAVYSNLASIHSYLENRFIQSLFANNQYIWLGGLSPAKDRIVWTDGSSNTYNRLSSIQNGSCVEMSMYAKDINSTWSWFGSDCSEQKISICKRVTI